MKPVNNAPYFSLDYGFWPTRRKDIVGAGSFTISAAYIAAAIF